MTAPARTCPPGRHSWRVVADTGRSVTLACRRCGYETTGEVGGEG